MKLILFLFGLLVYGCGGYENKDRYEIEVGETVEIYYSTNSCCYYCLSNKENLRHVKLLERKMIDSGPVDCTGCNYTATIIFKAESVGIDTVELKILGATMDCNSNTIETEKYIIEVK